jgi:hypothetical protein
MRKVQVSLLGFFLTLQAGPVSWQGLVKEFKLWRSPTNLQTSEPKINDKPLILEGSPLIWRLRSFDNSAANTRSEKTDLQTDLSPPEKVV